MDTRTIAVLEAELRGQLAHIDQVFETLFERVAKMRGDDQAMVEATSFQVHNYYSAAEDLLRIVAAAFENNITDASRWHSELIDRMTLQIDGVRPALLAKETAQALHKLRSFRHFFRHAYRVRLDESEVHEKVAIIRQVHPLLGADTDRFLSTLKS